MDFSGHLADADLQLTRAGFTSSLWIPEFGWENEAEELAMTPEQPQLLAAIQLFNQLFICALMRAWVHLAAEMQAGKTGVITTFIRLLLANAAKLRVKPNRIFILTGMNDDAWKKQTRQRMPFQIREGVQHSKGLGRVAAALHKLLEKDGTDTLSNVLVVLDESHIAASERNQPYKQIWATLQRLCPMDKWQERNIRIITISATDPAKVMAISTETPLPTAVVRLQTTERYQSVQKLVESGRIRYLDDFGDLHMCSKEFRTGVACGCKGHRHLPIAISEIMRSVIEDYEGEPLYHVLRPRMGKQMDVVPLLREAFPDAEVICWDASANSARAAAGAGGDDTTSTADLDDINEILSEPPATTTFIVLKNMFYAAKTLDDTHVGILYDRVGGKDDTNLQSLMGRACGYEKSGRTIVYSSKQTVRNYLECWRELCSNPSAPLLVNIPASHLDRKMTGVRATTETRGRVAKLSVAASVMTPLGKPSGDVAAAGGGSSPRAKANEENFDSEWREFKTLAEAKGFGPHIRTPRLENGFYQTSTTKGAKTLRYDEVMAMKGGKKTANLPWKSLEIGASVHRLYVGYKNISDPASSVFVVRRLTRRV
jgi:hypothetical protein